MKNQINVHEHCCVNNYLIFHGFTVIVHGPTHDRDSVKKGARFKSAPLSTRSVKREKRAQLYRRWYFSRTAGLFPGRRKFDCLHNSSLWNRTNYQGGYQNHWGIKTSAPTRQLEFFYRILSQPFLATRNKYEPRR